MIPLRRIYAVEVSGACNLEAHCKWCPMHNRPRSRPRGLMSDENVEHALRWVERFEKVDALALHVFGEPLLHPKFDSIAERFARLTPITMSTNGVLLDEKWADRLAKVPWAWISVSPWKPDAALRAQVLLRERGITVAEPPGVTHDWAGQAAEGKSALQYKGCPFLSDGKAVIRWDGSLASCCISDRAEDTIGYVTDPFPAVTLRPYSICAGCHHAI